MIRYVVLGIVVVCVILLLYHPFLNSAARTTQGSSTTSISNAVSQGPMMISPAQTAAALGGGWNGYYKTVDYEPIFQSSLPDQAANQIVTGVLNSSYNELLATIYVYKNSSLSDRFFSMEINSTANDSNYTSGTFSDYGFVYSNTSGANPPFTSIYAVYKNYYITFTSTTSLTRSQILHLVLDQVQDLGG